MAEGEVAGLDFVLDGFGKRNKRRKLATLARSLPVRCGHLFLGQLEVLAKSLIGAGLLHGVEIGALEVFDDGHLKCLLVGDLADDGGDGGFAGLAAGEPAAFAGDELVLYVAFCGSEGRTTMGWTTPEAAMDWASSVSSASSKRVRVW